MIERSNRLIFIISEKGGREYLNEVEHLEVIAHISRRTSRLLGAHKQCEPMRKTVITDIFGQLRHEFRCDLNRVRKKYIADIHEFIDCYEIPTVLKEKWQL